MTEAGLENNMATKRRKVTRCSQQIPGWVCTLPEQEHDCTYPIVLDNGNTYWQTQRTACRPMPKWWNLRAWVWHLSKGRI